MRGKAGQGGAGVLLAGPAGREGRAGGGAQAGVGDCREDGRRGVCGAVVQHDEFEGDALAGQDGGGGGADIGGLVAGGDEHGDGGRAGGKRRPAEAAQIVQQQAKRESGEREGGPGEDGGHGGPGS